jgi:membrane protein
MTDAVTRPNLLSFGELKRLLSRAYADFNEDQAPRLGAALAYYTALSLAPLLILLIAVAGLVFGKEAAQGQLFGEIRSMVGIDGAKAIEEMVQNAAKPASGIIASLIGLVTLLFGASSVASELRISLNTIWDRPQDPNEGITAMVKQRSYALAVVLGCGFLLLVSLAVSSVVAAAGKVATGWLPFSEPVLSILNIVISVAVITVVFAFLFKYLPDVTIEWRDVLLGALVTAVLFTIGKFLIGMYLGKASFGSTYGAAGSLVIVLVWVYYSAQIFFFGAEFTQVYACEHGSNPLCERRDRQMQGQAKNTSKALKMPPPIGGKTSDKPAPAAYAQEAAQGNATLNVSPEPAGKAVGWLGMLLGAVLAGSKVRGGLKK